VNEKNFSLGFTGDLSFSGYFSGHENDDSLIDEGIKDFLAKNDYNIINFESPVTQCRITKKSRLTHRCGSESLDFVKRSIPSPVLSFANNHMMDYGYIGVIDTLDAVSEAGMQSIGIGMNVNDAARGIILGKDIKVGVIAVEYKKHLIATELAGGPLHESSRDVIRRRISELKKQCSYVVLVYHGGDEFIHAPMPYTRRQLRQYLRWGCDIVVAHHPHTVQGYEFFGEKLIVYSLGNFIFDTDYQRSQLDTEHGMLLRIIFSEKGFTFESMPTTIDRAECRVLKGNDSRFFTNISNGYGQKWTGAAVAKKDIKQRAAELKEQELALRQEKFDAEQSVVEQLELAAELKKAALENREESEPDEETAGTDETETAETVSKLSLHSVTKKIYRRLIVKRSDNWHAIVTRAGRGLAWLLGTK